MTRIAIVGAGGQLANDLVEQLGDRALPLGIGDLDITVPQQVQEVLERHKPEAVINAAAYNFVDAAEEDPLPAFQVNAFGPRNLARECARLQLPFVHVSTDYVFGADLTRQRPYREEDCPGPIGAYAASKVAGEQLVRTAAPRHFIVRTCGLYGRPGAGGKGNFVQTVQRLASQQKELRIVDDQRCTPTSSRDLARTLIELLPTGAWGTYHATNDGECTWFEFASEIVRLLGLPAQVAPTTTNEFPRPAKRPAYSVLDCTRVAALLGHPLPSWQAAIAEYLGRE